MRSAVVAHVRHEEQLANTDARAAFSAGNGPKEAARQGARSPGHVCHQVSAAARGDSTDPQAPVRLAHRGTVTVLRVPAVAERLVITLCCVAVAGTAQLKRLKKVRVEYVDSALWQVGILQRVKTRDLRGFLRDNLEKNKATLEGLREGVERNRVLADDFDMEAAAADADVVVLQLQLRSVVGCVYAGRLLVRASCCMPPAAVVSPTSVSLVPQLRLLVLLLLQAKNSASNSTDANRDDDTIRFAASNRHEANVIWRSLVLAKLSERHNAEEMREQSRKIAEEEIMGTALALANAPRGGDRRAGPGGGGGGAGGAAGGAGAIVASGDSGSVSDSGSGSSTARGDLADLIRWKSTIERSAEEKEWVALDRMVNLHLYTALGTGACGLCTCAVPPARSLTFILFTAASGVANRCVRPAVQRKKTQRCIGQTPSTSARMNSPTSSASWRYQQTSCLPSAS